MRAKSKNRHGIVVLITISVAANSYAPVSAAGFFEKHIKKGVRWVEKKVDKGGVAVRKLARNPLNYTLNLPVSFISDVCSTPAQLYESTLRNQAKGNWNRLPLALINIIQPYYAINLNSVEYSQYIRTANGQAQTFGSRIYFPRSIDLTVWEDLEWLLHELEHSVQFRNAKYGEAGKLCEYMAKSVGNGFSHDRIDMERAADLKAAGLIEIAYSGMSLSYGIEQIEVLRPNQLWIQNDTLGTIRFKLETASIEQEWFELPPHNNTVVTGSAGDTWFNIYTGDNISFGVDGGTRQYLWFQGQNLIPSLSTYKRFAD